MCSHGDVSVTMLRRAYPSRGRGRDIVFVQRRFNIRNYGVTRLRQAVLFCGLASDIDSARAPAEKTLTTGAM